MFIIFAAYINNCTESLGKVSEGKILIKVESCLVQ